MITLAIMLIITILLCGCGSLASGDLIGTWSGAYDWKGDQYNVSIQFERNGNYEEIMYKNNSLHSSEDGTYTIEGKTVVCHKGSDGGMVKYKYKNGKLENNDHYLSKEN